MVHTAKQVVWVAQHKEHQEESLIVLEEVHHQCLITLVLHCIKTMEDQVEILSMVEEAKVVLMDQVQQEFQEKIMEEEAVVLAVITLFMVHLEAEAAPILNHLLIHLQQLILMQLVLVVLVDQSERLEELEELELADVL